MAASSDAVRRVVIIGAGFAGLRAAKTLRQAPVETLVIDRRNHHLFTPLLYEVATAGLAEGDIAQPVRAILRGARNTRFLMADIATLDLERRAAVTVDGMTVPYDYLIIAGGSVTTFFGVPPPAERLELKELTDASAIRDRVLRNFERAAATSDERERRRLMTIAVVGGGPTGVELAGAMAELKRHVLRRDFPELDVERAQVLLLEATDCLLRAMPSGLQRSARRQLEELGVEVRLSAPVRELDEHSITLAGGEHIDAGAVIWVAGVRAAPLGHMLPVELDSAGRVRVESTLQVRGHPEVFVAGDLSGALDDSGVPYPMMAPVAIRQGDAAARNVLRMIECAPPRPFRYRSSGSMVTIGRRRAVAALFGVQLSGTVAWFIWLFVHLLQLVGLRNKVLVLLNWVWNYVRYDRASRVVTGDADRD